MGIRIHKMMGYGLTDVEEGDPRVNWGSPAFAWELDRKGRLDEYLEWTKERGHVEVARSLAKAWRDEGSPHRDRFDLQECVAFGTDDGGMKNVLCLRPLAWRDWYRYDDAIDYAEAPNSEDTLVELRHGIFPHLSYMDDRDGERIKVPHDPHAWHRLRHSLEDAGTIDEPGSLQALDEFAKMAGFEDHADALAHCAPHVPDEVRWLAEWAGIFADPTAVLQLRPMIYTWWA